MTDKLDVKEGQWIFWRYINKGQRTLFKSRIQEIRGSILGLTNSSIHTNFPDYVLLDDIEIIVTEETE